VSRPPLIEFAGALDRVMVCGDRREAIFRDDRDRWKFLGYLAEGAKSGGSSQMGQGPDIVIWAHDKVGEWADGGNVQRSAFNVEICEAKTKSYV
jgi:hypothetical protein